MLTATLLTFLTLSSSLSLMLAFPRQCRRLANVSRGKAFGDEVGNLVVSSDEVQFHIPSVYMFIGEMKSDCYVLCARVLGSVARDGNGTLRITIN